MFHQAITQIVPTITENPFCAILDHVSIGVCLLDQSGLVVFENREFRRQRQDLQAVSISYQQDVILRTCGTQKNVLDLFPEGQDHFAIAVPIETDGEVSLLTVEGTKLDESSIQSTQFGYALMTRDMSCQPDLSPTFVHTAFGLTKAEAEISLMVCKGLTNSEIALRRCRSIETVNAQVKSILRKTCTANRTELLGKIGSFCAAPSGAVPDVCDDWPRAS